MKKLHLNLDDLNVDSFSTRDDDADAKGTVIGHATYVNGDCGSVQPDACNSGGLFVCKTDDGCASYEFDCASGGGLHFCVEDL
jgi:hypothetical protein